MIQIYTDGACIGNPGPGGWAAVIVEDGRMRTVHGGAPETTNNRMELAAVINGLKAAAASKDVTVYSDSQYVVLTMVEGWKRRKNLDLWADLDAEVAERLVRWEWVRGHVGDPLNEHADALARQEAKAHAHTAVEAMSEASRRIGTSEALSELDVSKLSEHGNSPARGLTHVDESGAARMVDVGWKPETQRVAVARGSVMMKPETLALIRANQVEKGDVLGVAKTAGIMGAKSTPQLIPLCHPIPLDQVTVEFALDDERAAIGITATASTTARTGVEMEAMTAVAISALTIYDMCKGVDRGMRIEGIRLSSKRGGKSGDIDLE